MKKVYHLFSLAFCTLFLSSVGWAQVGVKGNVTDTEGSPLTGVNILIKGTNIGSTTNADGNFKITASDKNSTLIFSFIGFKTLEYQLNGKTEISVEMNATATDLDQVVVSASRKKEKVLEAPASITVISAKELESTISLTATDHLYSASGVDVSKTGLTSSNVVTRGFNNVFSVAVLTMVDNRVASVPSLRVNSSQMIPGNNDDIASIEHTVKASGSVSEGGDAKELIKPLLPLRSPEIIAAAIVNLKQDSEQRRNGEAVT